MKRRLVNLRDEVPLLDIRSFGHSSHPPTPAERLKIALTVRRTPEVMVRVTGGARTVGGVKRHMNYVGRDGELALETDLGYRLEGPGVEGHLVRDWDLDLDQLAADRSIRGRKPVKLVHNILFSMPPGTPAEKVLTAVRQLAKNEWHPQAPRSDPLLSDAAGSSRLNLDLSRPRSPDCRPPGYFGGAVGLLVST
jgi:hypothetical protein